MISQLTIFGEELELTDQPSFPEVSPASPSPWLESKKVKGTTVTCGRRCSELSENLRRVGLSVRTYLASCELPLTTFVRTWSVLATKSGYLILKLRLSERCTGEKESRLLPTPVSTLGTNGGPNQRDSSGRPGLQMAAMLWPTPKAGKTTSDGEQERTATGRRIDGNGRTWSPSLADAVKMWPTPTTNDAQNSTFPASQINRSTLVGDVMRLFATPNAAHAQGTSGGGQSRDLRTDVGGQLNPRWVEWLMGFPLGWTDLNA